MQRTLLPDSLDAGTVRRGELVLCRALACAARRDASDAAVDAQPDGPGWRVVPAALRAANRAPALVVLARVERQIATVLDDRYVAGAGRRAADPLVRRYRRLVRDDEARR